MKKMGYRTSPIINRNSDDIEQNSSLLPNWMKDFANNLSKVSVQPRRQEDNIYDQISSIINSSKPKYSTVDAAVKDMQERSGLLAYQDKMKAMANSIKNAACACDGQEEPQDKKIKVKVFEINPQVQSTIDNYIEDTRGNLSIPAIIEKVKGIHRNDIHDDASWDDDQLLNYINDKCIETKKMHPDTDDSNASLGKLPHYDDQDIDPSNRDPLFSLNPTNVK